jgi:formylmethanofuran dehydrogenase subunit E
MQLKFKPKRSMAELLDMAIHFHGHLGSYLVVGLRMGLYGLKLLNTPGYYNLWVRSYTAQQPSQSCMNDGLQLSTGCTLGKGNISCSGEGLSQASFYATDKVITLKLHPDVEAMIAESRSEEQDEAVAAKLLEEPHDKKMFILVDEVVR